MKHIDVMFTRTNDGDYIADFDCAPSELPESNVFFFQAISAVDLVRSEAAEARVSELAAQLEQTKDAKELADYHFNQAIQQRDSLAAQLATAQAALERVTTERDNALAHIESYLEKFDDSSLSDDFVKRWLDNSWIPQSRRMI